MGIILLKKYFVDVTRPFPVLGNNFNSWSQYVPAVDANPVHTVGSLKMRWQQNLFSTRRPGPYGLIIRSVSTVFNSDLHGFYDATLNFSFLPTSGLSFTSQLSNEGEGNSINHDSFDRTIDLHWDGDSRNCWRDLDMDLGILNTEVNNCIFTLDAKESSSEGPIVHDRIIGTSVMPFPMYMTIVFEYY